MGAGASRGWRPKDFDLFFGSGGGECVCVCGAAVVERRLLRMRTWRCCSASREQHACSSCVGAGMLDRHQRLAGCLLCRCLCLRVVSARTSLHCNQRLTRVAGKMHVPEDTFEVEGETRALAAAAARR